MTTRRSARFAALLAVLALIAIGCTRTAKSPNAASSTITASSAPTTAAAPSGLSQIRFSNCSQQFRAAITGSRASEMQFGCGKLAVPLSYEAPNGPAVELFVVRVHYTAQQADARLGSLVVNPGGPGGSGVNLAASLVNSLSTDVFTHFDVIGFDPRGVGLSTPLNCLTDQQKDALAAEDPDVRTPAGRAQARVSAVSVVSGCVRRYGTALAHFNTVETARDLDRLRAAIGDSRLNYLGYSYGTRLGAVYAHLFPTRIRVAVLDGAVDPVAPELTTDEAQARAFEAAFDQFAADCRTRPACAVLGNPRTVVTQLVAAADRAPLKSSIPTEKRVATGGIVTTAVVSALYEQAAWSSLGQALVAARAGDARGLFALADQYNQRDATTGHYANLLDANLAVNCNDSSLAITDALVARVAPAWIAKYPIFGRNAAAALYSCYSWPKSGYPLPAAAAPGAPPILVIGTVHDPATPYPASKTLATALGSGVELTWDGEGHTAYPRTPCVTAKVNAYLITAVAPTAPTCPIK